MSVVYRERIETVRTLLIERDLDLFVIYAEGGRAAQPYLRWLTGIRCSTEDGLIAIIEREGGVRFIDVPWSAPVLTKRLNQLGLDAYVSTAPSAEMVRERFREIARGAHRIGYAGLLPASMCSGALDRYHLVREIDDLMVRKNAIELRWLADAAADMHRILADVLVAIEPGMRETSVADLVREGIFRCGGMPAFEPVRVVSGPRLTATTGHPDAAKVLHENDVVLIDAGHITAEGMFSDITRMTCLGQNEIAAEYQLLEEVVGSVAPQLSAGLRVRDALAIVQRELRERGLPDSTLCIEELGHSIGYRLHERPYLALTADLDTRLTADMVICLEPEVLTRHSAIRVEQEIAITASGGIILSR